MEGGRDVAVNHVVLVRFGCLLAIGSGTFRTLLFTTTIGDCERCAALRVELIICLLDTRDVGERSGAIGATLRPEEIQRLDLYSRRRAYLTHLTTLRFSPVFPPSILASRPETDAIKYTEKRRPCSRLPVAPCDLIGGLCIADSTPTDAQLLWSASLRCRPGGRVYRLYISLQRAVSNRTSSTLVTSLLRKADNVASTSGVADWSFSGPAKGLSRSSKFLSDAENCRVMLRRHQKCDALLRAWWGTFLSLNIRSLSKKDQIDLTHYKISNSATALWPVPRSTSLSTTTTFPHVKFVVYRRQAGNEPKFFGVASVCFKLAFIFDLHRDYMRRSREMHITTLSVKAEFERLVFAGIPRLYRYYTLSHLTDRNYAPPHPISRVLQNGHQDYNNFVSARDYAPPHPIPVYFNSNAETMPVSCQCEPMPI
ncbi:hypothetical protein R3P38DRAFT_2770025 [Favolaschia claudopus]|uniref:Uncharacterized protein n=1 Tax=Favolaschia claudopus TaxID=2862362 RepID=A0AAW0CMF7_9AGAR